MEEFHCIQKCPISGGWNRGVPLYTEVSSFQRVGIEEFHCTQRCPHFRVLEQRSSTVPDEPNLIVMVTLTMSDWRALNGSRFSVMIEFLVRGG